MHALNVITEFIYALATSNIADTARYAGRGKLECIQETETESCKLLAGCRIVIGKARKKNVSGSSEKTGKRKLAYHNTTCAGAPWGTTYFHTAILEK